MGSSDMDKSSKEAKEARESKAPTSQEQALSTSPGVANPDWSGFQTYSPVPPHGFLASNPQAHPYMWGVQPIMPPYGTPPHPYVAMYSHGGIYAHPSIPPGTYPFSPFAIPSPNGVVEASGNTPNSVEVDGKAPEGKDKLPVKRSKGSLSNLNMITGKNNEPVKTSGAVNGVDSKSAESASDGLSEGSDANSQNDSSQMRSGSRQDSLEDASQNDGAAHSSQNGGPLTTHPVVNQTMAILPMPAASVPGGLQGPTTNLNIGMDYWGAATTSTMPGVHGKVPTASVTGGMVTPGSREGVQPQHWLQDERELKRQKRKQSNRESARRSRLRKQAEYDELAQRADVLKEENAALRAEVNRIRSEYDQLLSQNASLKERVGDIPGKEDPRSNRNDQNVVNDIQHTSQS